MNDDTNNTSNTSEGNNDEVSNNKDLQAEIDRYERDMAAMQSEFNKAADSDDFSISAEAVRKAIIVAAPQAIQEIITLSAMAESESVRANTSKYIVDVALGKIKIGDPDADGLNKLLKELSAPNPT